VKIAVYCQHVLGMGHLFRTLEIVAALAGHTRLLIVGGPDTPAVVPDGVRVTRLPELSMDAGFSGLSLAGEALAAVKDVRQKTLWQALAGFRPDVFFVELYPFGRKAFEFELLPALSAIREGRLGACKVACGLRDILVEKKDPVAYEARVLDRLTRFFDAVLVHADPALFPISATFSRVVDIPVPVSYTGYVAGAPTVTRPRQAVRESLGAGEGRELIVASAGGGKVGSEALLAVLTACRDHPRLSRAAIRVFSGPFADDAAFAAMEQAAKALPDARVARFTDGFADILAATDLSVSLAGYNTVMGVLAAGARALVAPFDQNREQRMRAERLQALGLLGVLDASDLTSSRLAARMVAALDAPSPPKAAVDLNGAHNTALLLERLFR
jgi:predicted glycosyltransferase